MRSETHSSLEMTLHTSTAWVLTKTMWGSSARPLGELIFGSW